MERSPNKKLPLVYHYREQRPKKPSKGWLIYHRRMKPKKGPAQASGNIQTKGESTRDQEGKLEKEGELGREGSEEEGN